MIRNLVIHMEIAAKFCAVTAIMGSDCKILKNPITVIKLSHKDIIALSSNEIQESEFLKEN